MNTKPDLDTALTFDPLSEAEKITGLSYKEDDRTSFLGMMLALENNRLSQRLLIDNDDTYHAQPPSDYLRVAADIGFRVVHEEPFEGRLSDAGAPIQERFFILYHDEYGALLSFDSFGGNRVNGGTWSANWIPHDPQAPEPFPMSHFWKDDVQVITGDCRKALRYHMRLLAEQGRFVKPWVGAFLHTLRHYMDERKPWPDQSYLVPHNRRLDSLPGDVREVVSVFRKVI